MNSPQIAPERALGAFIRAHREQLRPEDVGIPGGRRRRAVGLRREEVAQLCGVSPTWYTWIEQGRPVYASAEALSRIAGALRLSRAERSYLFELAARRDPDSCEPEIRLISPTLLRTIAHLPDPAYLLDRYWTAVAWNPAAEALFGGWLDRGTPASENALQLNLLWFTFAIPAAQALIVNWHERARRLVAEFRADTIRQLNDAMTRELIGKLSAASPTFATFWSSQDVTDREGGKREFEHPLRGYLCYEQLTLKPTGRDDLKLVVLSEVSQPPKSCFAARGPETG